MHQFTVQCQEPGPAVGTLEGLAGVTPQIAAFTGNLRCSELLIELVRHALDVWRARIQGNQPGQQPVHVDRGMPVVAAEEDRMQGARRSDFARVLHEMVGLVGIFRGDVVLCQFCELGGHLLVKQPHGLR